MATFLYRDELTRKELLPAIGAGAGAGIGVGVVVAYFTQLFLRRRRRRSGDQEPTIRVVPVGRPSGRN
jgi:hypothetical protein